MKCPSCDFENESGVKFCANCGEKISEPAAMTGKNIFCANCGQKNPPGSRFCQDCGSDILTGLPASHAAPVKRTAGWAWLLLGLAVVLVGAGLFYFLTIRPSTAVTKEPAAVSNASVVTQAAGTCNSDEKMLYSEDFQDGKPDGWLGLPSFYSVGPAVDDEDNLVLVIQKPETTSGQVQAGSQLNLPPFTDAVLRLRFYLAAHLPDGNNDWISFNWLYAPQPFTLEGTQVFDSRYQITVGHNYFEMRRLQHPVTNVSVDHSATYPLPGKWHSLEISTKQPRTEIRMDGILVMEYVDPEPLPPGSFGLEAWLKDPQVQFLFDDITICELTPPD